ncbi:MAG: family 16 glycosylhydrolase, partial [Kineosporiaceae bacterium]
MAALPSKALGVALVAASLVASPGPADGAQTVRRTALSRVVRDSHGRRWSPAGSAFAGGRTRRVPAPRVAGASPQLYASVRDGVRRIVLTVPRPGRYAVVLYLADPTSRPDRRVFDVFAQDRRVRSRADAFLLRNDPVGRRPLHTMFETVVRGRRLTVSFRGRAPVAAIEARRLGAVSLPPARPSWRDDFTGPAGTSPNPALWSHETGAKFAHGVIEAATDRPANSSLDGAGHLVIQALRERYTMENVTREFTSARLRSTAYLPLSRGLISVRMRLPATQGTWSTFWFSGDEPPPFPANGEFDVVELDGGRPSLLHTFFHYPLGSPGGVVDRQINGNLWLGSPLSDGLRTYSVLVEPEAVEVQMDGRRLSSFTLADLPPAGAWPLTSTMRLLLTLDIGGDFVPAPTAAASFPAQMVI